MGVWRVLRVTAGSLQTSICSLRIQVDRAPANGSYRTVWRMHLSWTVIAYPNSFLMSTDACWLIPLSRLLPSGVQLCHCTLVAVALFSI